MRIIIVEDEGVTRLWLKKKIEELSMDYHIQGLFSNGQQALEYCEEHQVDVIFTDIRMAVMGGLEFLEQMKDLPGQPYKVILSAYDEFQYVRQAMKLGAHEFILKPEVTREEIRRILIEADNYLESRKTRGTAADDTAEQFLLQLIGQEGALDGEELSSAFEEKGVMLSPKELVLAALSIEGEVNTEELKEITALFFEEEKVRVYILTVSRSAIILLYNQKFSCTKKQVMERLYSLLQQHFHAEFYIGISRGENGFDRIKDMLRQGEAAGNNRRFFGITGVLQYEDMEKSAKSWQKS